jgi:hypothetical protein
MNALPPDPLARIGILIGCTREQYSGHFADVLEETGGLADTRAPYHVCCVGCQEPILQGEHCYLAADSLCCSPRCAIAVWREQYQ